MTLCLFAEQVNRIIHYSHFSPDLICATYLSHKSDAGADHMFCTLFTHMFSFKII